MSAIGTSASLTESVVREPSRGFAEVSSEDFMSMILSELTNQDPMEPNDTEALLNQISTLRNIESDEKMLDSLEGMVDSNEFASAANLIGTLISGISETNQRVADVVLSVSNTDEGPVLNLFDGSRVAFENVDEIVAPLTLDEQGDDEDAPDDDTGNGDDGDDSSGGTDG